jgi:hypothetical protein
MKQLFHYALFVIVGHLISFGAISASAQTPPACACAFVKDQPPQGVSVVFAGELQPRTARAGTIVLTGDLIKVTPEVRGTLVCDNVQNPVFLTRTPRSQPVPCKSSPEEGILIGRNGRKIDGRTMSDTSDVGFPVALSPRSTKLRDARPVLRWTAIPDATTYKITVRGEAGSWSANVPAKPGAQVQEVVYPQPCASERDTNCAPPLRAGETYKLVVEANGRNSEEEDLPNMGFTLLPGEEVRKVLSLEEGINRLALEDSLKTKMRASLYANYGLNADAITLVEGDPLAQRNPEVVRLLGDIYLKLGLTRRAEALYLNLLKPDLVAQDTPAGKAATHQTLGDIYEALGNLQEAIKYYEEAKSLYLGLKDRETVRKIEARLSDLRR